MHIIITGFAAAALIATPVLAETKPGTVAPAAETTEQTVAKDHQYCVRVDFTGSRLAKKVCKTRAQWMDEDNFDPLAQK